MASSLFHDEGQLFPKFPFSFSGFLVARIQIFEIFVWLLILIFRLNRWFLLIFRFDTSYLFTFSRFFFLQLSFLQTAPRRLR